MRTATSLSLTMLSVILLAAALAGAKPLTAPAPANRTAKREPAPPAAPLTPPVELDAGQIDDRSDLAATGSTARPKLGPVPGKIVRYVANLIRQYDTDEDGVLDEQEWRGVGGNPQEADIDHDGMITSAELTQRIVVYSRHRSLRLAPPSRRGASPLAAAPQAPPAPSAVQLDEQLRTAEPLEQLVALPPQPETAEAPESDADTERARELARRSRKFFVPRSRFPAGLANWFVDRDADGDGQITLREFSAKWSPEVAAEFAEYDRNGDGIVTAAESVRRDSQAAAAKPASPPEK